jgi:vaccinia related kinase
VPVDTLFVDLTKKEWRLGKPIGSGGFGLIYLTHLSSAGPVNDDAEYCMKIEPSDNGPLF